MNFKELRKSPMMAHHFVESDELVDLLSRGSIASTARVRW